MNYYHFRLKEKIMIVDIERLREDLLDYYGTASQSGFPMAIVELGNVENASPYQLVEMAKDAGVDLSDYTIDDDYER